MHGFKICQRKPSRIRSIAASYRFRHGIRRGPQIDQGIVIFDTAIRIGCNRIHDIHQPSDFCRQSGFFMDFPKRRRMDGFTYFLGAARQAPTPYAWCFVPLDQDDALVADDDSADADERPLRKLAACVLRHSFSRVSSLTFACLVIKIQPDKANKTTIA